MTTHATETAVSENHLAARAIALHAPGTLAQRRKLLDMLGLLTPEGEVNHAPLDPNGTVMEDVNGSLDKVKHSRRGFAGRPEAERDRSAVPEGLRSFQP